MTQLDKLRSMSVEEVACERVHLKTGCPGKWYYVGDFYGRVMVNNYECSVACVEAIRLEIAWLESEVGE